MSRLLCLTELLRRLSGHQRAAAEVASSTGSAPSLPGSAAGAYRDPPPARIAASLALPLDMQPNGCLFLHRQPIGCLLRSHRREHGPLDEVFRALADPGRRRLLDSL